MTYEEENKKIRTLLGDDDFLERLREIARIYGWAGDYTEIGEFLRYLYKSKDLEVPDLNPYEDEN